MKKRYISLFACTLLSMPAQAALTAYDGFDYTADEVVVGKNGGSGFSNAWTSEGGSGYTVKVGGLTFSDLSVTGGRVQVQASGGWAASSRIGRDLSVSAAGQTYGSFLFRLQSPFDTNNWEVAGLLIGAAGEGDNDHTAAVYPSEWGQPVGARLEGNFAGSNGSALTQGETFLVLFSSNLSNGSQALSMWVLNSNQFDNFKTGGLTEAELNGAGVGSGNSNVWAKTSVSGTDPTLDGTGNLKFMTFGGNDGMEASYDELRLSQTSLNEVAPVIPEPTSALLGLVGFAALLRRRR
jgi:uncharacterized protein (TIGR03382 family)